MNLAATGSGSVGALLETRVKTLLAGALWGGAHINLYTKKGCLVLCQRPETAGQLGAIIQAGGNVRGVGTFLSW